MSRPLNSAVTATPPSPAAHPRKARTSRPHSLQLLIAGEEAEALNFLAAHPVRNAIMLSLIRDNGFERRHNRGDFYACRDARGALTGVALIGHHILFAGRCAETIGAFARQAREHGDAHVILSDRESVGQFWAGYAQGNESPLRVQRELLLEQKRPGAVREFVPGLRQAMPADIEHIATAHAQLAFEESRVNPLEADREGFLARVRRRVDQGRIWVWIEEDRLIFKTDVFSHTPEVIYLEGVYVNSSERGKGNGLRCLSQLSRELLLRAKSICLLVDEENERARAFYQRAGYKLHSHYDTIYLPPQR